MSIWSRDRPLRIHDVVNGRTVDITARSLADVKDKVFAKFWIIPDTCRIFVADECTTEVENEEYFSRLPDNIILVVMEERGEWITGAAGLTFNKIRFYYLVNYKHIIKK